MAPPPVSAPVEAVSGPVPPTEPVASPALPRPSSAPAQAAQEVAGHVRCPHCHNNFARRSRRKGFREHLFSWFFRYPFRCQVCGHRFRAFQVRRRYRNRPQERRQLLRVGVHIPVTFVQMVKPGQELVGQGVLLDLTRESCYLQTTTSLPVGASLNLALQMTPEAPVITIDLAMVRHVRPQGVSLVFLRVSDTTLEAMHRYLEERRAMQALGAPEDEHTEQTA